MKRENVFFEQVGKIEAKVVFSKEAMFGCSDNCIVPMVASSLVSDAGNYVRAKEVGERFTIVSTELRTVVVGSVMLNDEDYLELIVTNVYGDAYILRNKDYASV